MAGAALAAALWLSSCAVEVQNTQPAKQLALSTKSTGTVYAGWRVFQDRCARCHGLAATGGANAPNLLPRVSEMGPQRFVGIVLRRYDWKLPTPSAGGDAAALDAFIDSILQRKEGELAMPAWQGEPRVSAHIADLYAYLSARAQGAQGPGRPEP